MAKRVRGINGYWLASDLGFLRRWAEYGADDLADSLKHARKGQAVKAVLDEALPVLLDLRKLLQ
jgi:hypothetical protein